MHVLCNGLSLESIRRIARQMQWANRRCNGAGDGEKARSRRETLLGNRFSTRIAGERGGVDFLWSAVDVRFKSMNLSGLFLAIGFAALWMCCYKRPLMAQQSEPPNPVLIQRPAAKPLPLPGAIERAGSMQLDVVVTDFKGNPVLGLEPWDFALTDNNEARRILTFHSFNGTTVKPEPPVEVILLLDTVNLPFQQVAFVRQQVEQFLREDGGRLKQPGEIMLLTDGGLRVQPRPSLDGNALVGIVEGIKGSVSSINPAMGGQGLVERYQLSVRQLQAIAENRASRPGRKLLIWVGPGWPLLDAPSQSYSEKDQRRTFDGIVELSTKLREARMAVYSVAPQDATVDSGLRSEMYRQFLKGVKSAKQADSGNLALKVLVTQSGGLILGPGNDLAAQIDRCVADANGFYRISFDPAHAAAVNEYHELKVVVKKPDLVVRTNVGYYSEGAPGSP
jgi:VWFA-related protein